MNPDNIQWVEFSEHALDNLDRVSLTKGEIIRKIKSKGGVIFRDTENGRWRYDLYDHPTGTVVPFEVQLQDGRGKAAVVMTVFRIHPGKNIARYNQSDRFEFVSKP